jgi:hypothetical protein
MVRLLRILELLSLLLLHILGQAVSVSLEMWDGEKESWGSMTGHPMLPKSLKREELGVCIKCLEYTSGLEPVISECLCLKGDNLPR